MASLRALASIVRNPVPPITKWNLDRAWERLPEAMRTPQQMYGRHAEGCGATIGAMPRCDFACTGCYLGEEANQIPSQPVEEIKAQMRLLRTRLGYKGNLQLTDGEVTLRPEDEVVELLQYANEIGLIPMLMTHGDTFRRQPGLLERLIVEGGLMEVSIHVDVTQRGRKGAAYKHVATEAELNPLRDEFAQMLRDARKRTGRKISAATTLTIDPGNLDGVPDVMRWLVRNADVFKMISFQPMAQVGRTEAGLGGAVAVQALWKKIAEGIDGDGADPARLLRGEMWLGHSACNKYVPIYVVTDEGRATHCETARLAGDALNEKVFDEFWRRMGGLSFRNDGLGEAIARATGTFAHTVDVFAKWGIWYWGSLLQRLSGGDPVGFLSRIVRRRARVNGLLIVSHHFMSDGEIDTELGRERLGLCVFHVPVNGELVSMCEVNATGIRDAYYEDIRAGRVPGSTPPERLVQLQRPVSALAPLAPAAPAARTAARSLHA